MLLAIDVGNTNISMGILDQGKTVGSFRLTTKTPRTSDEFGICISTLLEQSHINPEEIEDVIISSVVPKCNYALNSCIRKYLKKEPMIIGPGMKTGIKLKTENAREVGADRIVDVAAARHLYHTSCIIVDFGTATTFDYVSADGVFEYTVIAPGLGICAQALTKETAKLPEIEIKRPQSVLGRNTIEGMQSGVVYGYIGLVEYIIRKMKKELKDPDCHVVATGGLGRVIADDTELIDDYDPDLAYKGMYEIYKKNKAGKSRV